MPTIKKAREIVRLAVLSGRLTRPTICSKCGSSEQILGHHKDYSKPLEVTWLCWKCHRSLHPRTRRNDGTHSSQVITNRVVGYYLCQGCKREITLYENQRRKYCPDCLPLVASESGKRGGRPKKAKVH